MKFHGTESSSSIWKHCSQSTSTKFSPQLKATSKETFEPNSQHLLGILEVSLWLNDSLYQKNDSAWQHWRNLQPDIEDWCSPETPKRSVIFVDQGMENLKKPQQFWNTRHESVYKLLDSCNVCKIRPILKRYTWLTLPFREATRTPSMHTHIPSFFTALFATVHSAQPEEGPCRIRPEAHLFSSQSAF